MSFTFINSDKAGISGWVATCASSDFKNIMLASSKNGYAGIKISNDYGLTWYDTVGGLSNNTSGNYFRAACCSTDFKNITAVREGGAIWISNDYGINWTSKNPATNWYGVCGSTDMTKQAAVQTSGNIWISTDSGSTWTPKATSLSWRFICCSADFTKLGAVVANGNIWISTDSGSTWDAKATSLNWRSIACTPNFQSLVACVQAGGGIYKSTDYGNTWTPTTAPTTGYDYVSISCSEDLKNIMATSYNQFQIVYSTDYGSTWTTVSGLPSYNWHTCTIKNNRFIFAANNQTVYIGKFDYDKSLFNVYNETTSEQNIIKQVDTYSSTTGALIDRPVSYSRSYYQFNFSSGTVNSYSTQTSTGLDANSSTTFVSSGLNTMVFRNLSSLPGSGLTFPNGGNPAQVLYFPNSSSGSNQNYLTQLPHDSFYNLSVSLWIDPSNITVPNKYISVVNISLSSSTRCFDIMIDGNSSNNQIALFINGTSNIAVNRIVGTTKLSSHRWSHIVCSYNSITGYGKIYVNGLLDGIGYIGQEMNAFNATLLAMAWGSNTGSPYGSYNGYMAYYNLFNREITLEEVQYLYNNPSTDIQYMTSLSSLYTGTSTNLGYAVSGGGIPMLRGQPAFGTSIYSKANIPLYKSINISYPDFAPYYTVYTSTTSPAITANTDYTHTLQNFTKYVLVIAIGGGGGGGGGGFAYNMQMGSGGGGGAGGGMGWVYMDVSNINNRELTVRYGTGGTGGISTAPDNIGNAIYVGGNGLDGTGSYVKANILGTITTLCQGNGGAKAFNRYNNKYNNQEFTGDGIGSDSSVKPYFNENTLNVFGDPKTNTSVSLVSTGSNTYRGKAENGGDGGINGFLYSGRTNTDGSMVTIDGTIISPYPPLITLQNTDTGYATYYNGGIIGNFVNGTNGLNGGISNQSNPPGGSGGDSGMSSGILINGQTLISNDSYYKFINKNGSLIVDSQTLRTYGKGGNGGFGEGTSAGGNTPGSDGNDGAVLIFEYL